MKNNTLVLYIHGKGGTAEEAEHYSPLFSHCDVVGLDYKAEAPWEAKAEFPAAFEALAEGYSRVILIANSIGAYFAMCALPQEKIAKAYFISPIVNMGKLIGNMMNWANVSEDELCEKGTIETAFGETLSWEYLCYVRSHPIRWNVPTEILYGVQDNLTDRATVTTFANDHRASLTVMENGEHWFHTAEQMKYLDTWLMNCENTGKTVGTPAGKVNCPCKKTKCERHGNCDACRAYHTGSKRKRPCERTKNSRT